MDGWEDSPWKRYGGKEKEKAEGICDRMTMIDRQRKTDIVGDVKF